MTLIFAKKKREEKEKKTFSMIVKHEKYAIRHFDGFSCFSVKLVKCCCVYFCFR